MDKVTDGWCKSVHLPPHENNEKVSPMYLLHQRLARIPVVGCTAWMLATAPGFVAAQVPGLPDEQRPNLAPVQSPISQPAQSGAVRQGRVPGEQRQAGLWFEPRVTVRHTVTNNAKLDATQQSDQLTELMPGFRLVSDTARIKGYADYTLRYAHYARNSAPDKIWHNLFARGTVEAVEKHAFVDLGGIVTLQPISAFGSTGGYSPASSNMTQTSTFRVSPYLRGNFSDGLDYEARYALTDTRYDTGARSNVSVQDWLLHLGRRPIGQMWSWGVDATQQNADYSNGRNIDTTAVRGRLSYSPMPQLRLAVIGGFESTNQLSLTKKSHDITGFGVDWRPSDRSRVSLERESRYFGESHNARFEYRTAQTVWRYTDKRGIVTGLGAQLGSMGPLSDLLDGFYSRTEPNPIRRAQLVQSEIARLGLPADMQVFPDFLTSSSTLRRLQQLSFALLGQRSTLTLLVMRSDSRLLDNSLLSGDDFSTNSRIRQHGWNLMLGHRLTPNASLSASFGETRSVGSIPGLETRTRPFIVGWNTLVARRTNVGIQLRRVLSDGNVSRYSESAIMGLVTHRF